MTAPTVRVEAGLTSAPDDPVQSWTDVTAYVWGHQPVTMSCGRTDEQDAVAPGRAALALDNADLRFTYGYASGAYYPNVVPGKRLRVSVSPDSGATWWPRFDGYVDGWPVSWQANGNITTVDVSATDRLARFSRMRQLRDPLAEELGTAAYVSGLTLGTGLLDDASTATLAGGVVWLYGLQEGSGATTAGDVSGALGRPTLALSQVGTGGSMEFGAAGLMPEGTAAKFTPASAGNGLVLTHSGLQSYIGTEFSIWCQFAWSGSTGAQLVSVGAAPSGRVVIATTSTTVTATFTAPDASTATATKTVTTNDSAPHFALVSVSGTTISLYVDDLTAATATLPTYGMGTAQGLTIGGTTSANEHQVAWVGYSNAATSATRAAELAALACGDAERSDLRVGRILRWLGLTGDAVLETGLSSIAYQATGGRVGLDVITELNAVEQGAFYADGSGRYVFQSRGHRYNVEPAVTLTAEQVLLDTVAVDLTSVVNDYQASRPRGSTYRARNDASITAYGPRTASATLYAASDTDLITAADWYVQRYGQPAPRIPSIQVDLLSLDAATTASVLSLGIGSKLRLTGLPTVAPGGATSVDLWVEGITERVGVAEWALTLTTSPVGSAVDAVWVLDSGELGTSTVLAY